MIQGGFLMKHLISPLDLSVEELDQLLDLAQDIEANPKKYAHACDGKKLATLFYEPSTRTRLSHEAAMLNLGGSVMGFSSADSSSASKGESVSDTIRVISCYADICAMRHPKEGAPIVASQYSTIPIINAAVHLVLFISQDEDMIQSLFDRSDAAGILTADDILDLTWKLQRFFRNDLSIFYDIYSDIMIDETENIQIHEVDRAFNLHDILFPHFITFCIFDNSNATVQLVKVKIFINLHAFSAEKWRGRSVVLHSWHVRRGFI